MNFEALLLGIRNLGFYTEPDNWLPQYHAAGPHSDDSPALSAAQTCTVVTLGLKEQSKFLPGK